LAEPGDPGTVDAEVAGPPAVVPDAPAVVVVTVVPTRLRDVEHPSNVAAATPPSIRRT
jgi:hypothetical protein